MAYDIGAEIGLEGEKEYRKALNDCGKDLSVLTSELKLNSSQFDGNANSMEAIEKKSLILNKQYETQKDKVELLRRALENANTTYGENSNQVKNWQIKLNNAEVGLNTLGNELKSSDKYLDEAKKSTDKCATSIDEFGKEIETASKKTGVFGDVLKANLATEAIVDGLRKASSEAADFVKKGIANASSLTESQNVVDVTFGESANVINDWSKTLATGFGMSELQGKKFSGTMGAMLDSMGLTTDQTLEMSTGLVELAGDMASFYNLDTEDAFAKLRSGISGETEPLKQLGLNLSVANLEAYALSQGITEAYSSMGQAEKALLSYNYLMKLTANAQGDFSRTSDGYANQQRIFALQMDNIATSIGQGSLPELQRGFNVLNESLEQSGINFEDLSGKVTGGIVDALLWLIDNLPLVESGIVGITSATLVSKTVVPVVQALQVAWLAHKVATDSATTSQTALNVAQSSNPMGLLITVVAGVTAALVTYSLVSDKATSDTEKLAEATMKEIEELNNSIESRKESAKNLQTESTAITKLKEELVLLTEKEKLSTAEKSRMEQVVSQLNTAIPSLNLSIDEQTGLVKGNTEEIEKSIDANLEYMKVIAAQEELGEIAKEQYETEKLLISTTEEKIALQEKFTEGVQATDAVVRGYEKTEEDLQEKLKGLSMDYENASLYVNEHSDALNINADAMSNVGNNTVEFRDKTITVSDEVKVSIDALKTTYDELQFSADESLSSQVELFGELVIESELSTTQIADNLASQAVAFTQYQADLITAQQLVSKGFDTDMLRSIQTLGIDGAGTLHELVTSFDTDRVEFNRVMNEWAKLEGVKETLTGTMADVKMGYSNEMGEIFGIANENTKYMNMSALEMSASVGTMATGSRVSALEMSAAVGTMASGQHESALEMSAAVGDMVFGFKDNATQMSDSAKSMVSDALSSIDSSLGLVDGKSLTLRVTGSKIPSEIAAGIESGASAINSALNSALQGAIDNLNINSSGLLSKINKALGEKM